MRRRGYKVKCENRIPLGILKEDSSEHSEEGFFLDQ